MFKEFQKEESYFEASSKKPHKKGDAEENCGKCMECEDETYSLLDLMNISMESLNNKVFKYIDDLQSNESSSRYVQIKRTQNWTRTNHY